MAIAVFPQRVKSVIRPSVATGLVPSSLTRGLAAYWHVNAPAGYLSSSNQIFRNLVTEETPWTYPAVVSNAAILRLATNNFGGMAMMAPGQISITNVNPVIDASTTGPGYTIAAWGCPLVTTGSLDSQPICTLTDGTTVCRLTLANSSGSGSIPSGTNNANVVSGGKTRFRQWTHVAFTCNETTAILYQDGQQVGSIAVSSSGSAAVNQITLNTFSTGIFGLVCDYAIWRRALTAIEVYSLWDPRTRWNHLKTPAPNRYIPFTPVTPPAVTFIPRLMVLGTG